MDFIFNAEEQKFKNMDRITIFKKGGIRNRYLEIYEIENTLTLEEKIKIIDAYKDNLATYFINLNKLWEKESVDLPKDRLGDVKTVSKKAWVKRNNTKKVFSSMYPLEYRFLGRVYYINSMKCPLNHGYSQEYTGEHVAHQWFHDLCREFEAQEEEYFKNNDTTEVKLNLLENYIGSTGTTFNIPELDDLKWNHNRNISDAHVDVYIEAYENLTKFIDDLAEEIKQKIK